MTKPASAPLRATEALPRNQRIARRRDYTRAYEKGRKVFTRYTVVFALQNELGHPRIGVTTTRKLGGAVVRNRMKRWVREVFRLEQGRLGLDEKPLDIVVNLRKPALAVGWDEFRSDLLRALKKAARGLASGE